ncbi:MAG TPA: hypothetical protein VMZ22_00035 [Acidimicrobiales bacterium]|nr:hypothetical protein [Acidimicrobiales bacterium]
MESFTKWLGEISPHVTDGVVAAVEQHDDRLTVLRLTATRDLQAVATGDFANPSNYWSFDTAGGDAPEGSVGFGFQYCEFAMPTITDASLQGWFLFPARPSLVLPMMLIAPDDRTLLIAPLNSFHEQVGAVEDGVRIGWHGDLDVVAEGFTTELALWSAASPRAAFREWGLELQQRYRTARPGRYDDDLARHPSYWTDNGAAYWYKTAPGRSTTETLVDTVNDLRERDVPFSTVQLDSWWYPHQTLRPFNTDEWLVPPTGLMRWEPRDDVVPDGVVALRDALGSPPLAAHCRHVSSQSSYLDTFDCWVDGERAHPKGPELYERWLDQCVEWGVETFEHDWLIEAFLGVRGLREEPGRARAWQEGIDRAAGRRDITLQWCMPSPADICQTVTLANVTSIRTSGDHGYLVSAGYLWAWFLYTNVFAGALGLHPYKDVFHTQSEHAEVEALLSALSTGPVGIGDPLGRADASVVRRTCRADGVLVKPDTPVMAIDRAFRKWATRRGQLMTGTTGSGVVDYVVTLNCTDRDASGRVEPEITTRSAVWDWRAQTLEIVEPGGGWDLSLASLDWDYRVVAPIVDGVAVIGDPVLYATAGDMRVHHVDGDTVTVVGPNDAFDLVWWTERDGLQQQRVEIGDVGWAEVKLRE